MLFNPLNIRAQRVVPSRSKGTVLGVGLVALNTSDWSNIHSMFLCAECVCSRRVLFWFCFGELGRLVDAHRDDVLSF